MAYGGAASCLRPVRVRGQTAGCGGPRGTPNLATTTSFSTSKALPAAPRRTRAAAMAEPLPPALRTPDISRFINRANQLRAVKPAIAYWCASGGRSPRPSHERPR